MRYIFFAIVLILTFTSFIVTAKELDFDLNSFFVQTILSKGESSSASVQFINTGMDQQFSLKATGDFFQISEKNLFVKNGEGVSVPVYFNTSLVSEGVHVGQIVLSSQSFSTVIPVILGVESKSVLFDVKASVLPQFTVVRPGDDLPIDLQVFNLGSLNKNVLLSYYISDLNGNIIVTDSQTVEVGTKTDLTRELFLPKNIPLGDYVLYVTATNGNSLGLSTFLFTVSNNYTSKNKTLIFVIIFAVVLLFLFLFSSFWWTKRLANSSKYWNERVDELKKIKTGSSARKLRKLQYELGLLEDARSKGYIKMQSYRETKSKLESMIRQLKKRL